MGPASMMEALLCRSASWHKSCHQVLHPVSSPHALLPRFILCGQPWIDHSDQLNRRFFLRNPPFLDRLNLLSESRIIFRESKILFCESMIFFLRIQDTFCESMIYFLQWLFVCESRIFFFANPRFFFANPRFFFANPRFLPNDHLIMSSFESSI